VTACAFGAEGDGKGMRAKAIDVVGLGIACFASAVDYVVVFFMLVWSWASEDAF